MVGYMNILGKIKGNLKRTVAAVAASVALVGCMDYTPVANKVDEEKVLTILGQFKYADLNTMNKTNYAGRTVFYDRTIRFGPGMVANGEGRVFTQGTNYLGLEVVAEDSEQSRFKLSIDDKACNLMFGEGRLFEVYTYDNSSKSCTKRSFRADERDMPLTKTEDAPYKNVVSTVKRLRGILSYVTPRSDTE